MRQTMSRNIKMKVWVVRNFKAVDFPRILKKRLIRAIDPKVVEVMLRTQSL
jgi:hypothetical protein